MIRPLALSLAAAAAVSVTSAPAVAAPCYGLDALRVCFEVHPLAPLLPEVDLYGSSIDECVHLGGDTCKPVSIPVPTVEPGGGGRVVTIECYMGARNCFERQ